MCLVSSIVYVFVFCFLFPGVDMWVVFLFDTRLLFPIFLWFLLGVGVAHMLLVLLLPLQHRFRLVNGQSHIYEKIRGYHSPPATAISRLARLMRKSVWASTEVPLYPSAHVHKRSAYVYPRGVRASTCIFMHVEASITLLFGISLPHITFHQSRGF